MKASVIVPCWNVERWLDRCLDEVLAALPPDSEIVAVDDGSDDATLERLRVRAGRDARIKVIASGHRGVSAARNIALDAAKGEYIFFADPDDGVEPDFFTAMIGRLERDHADYCVCAYRNRIELAEDFAADTPLKGEYRYSSRAEIIRCYLPRIFGYSADDVRAWYAGTPLFSKREMAGVWRGVFRRSIIEANRVRFDETVELFEDAMFTADYLLRCASMTSLDRALYRCTRRSTGAMTVIPRSRVRLCRNKLALLRHRERLDAENDGALRWIFSASCVFSLLEVMRCRQWRIAREMLGSLIVRDAIGCFPLSPRRPFLAFCVIALRALTRLTH